MQSVLSILKNHSNMLMKLLPLVVFTVPILWLYLLDASSFELMWKGRTFQLFFIWLIALELILNWETLQPNKIDKLPSAKTFALIAVLLLPTVYVATSNYLGLNIAMVETARQIDIMWWNSMALSAEYLVFTVLFCLMIFLQFGKKVSRTFQFLSSFSAQSASCTRSTTSSLTDNLRRSSCSYLQQPDSQPIY